MYLTSSVKGKKTQKQKIRGIPQRVQNAFWRPRLVKSNFVVWKHTLNISGGKSYIIDILKPGSNFEMILKKKDKQNREDKAFVCGETQ
jgi:hypothetical protein